MLKSTQTLDPKDVVLGQFKGYHDEPGVKPDSKVETFAALRLHINSWRWRDVPFYIRTGKLLPSQHDRGRRKVPSDAACLLRRCAAAELCAFPPEP